MSKIFDALRKVEQESPDLAVPPLGPSLPASEAHPRQARTLETEFGRLGSALLSSFTKSKDGRVVLVVGAVEREGATYVTTHLGRALAAGCGGSVLCLDGNFHDPALGRHAGVQSGLGLTDVGENGYSRELPSVIQRGDVNNLFVLTPGRTRISAVAFFDSPQFDAILQSVRRSFRFTLIDGPPLLAHADSIHLAAQVDGVLLVVRQGRLKREVLQKALEPLQSLKVPILGAVLNRRRFAIPSFVYKLIS